MACELTVIATGNVLMGDDGVAVRIIERLNNAPPGRTAADAGIEYLDGSVGGLRLLNWIEQAKRLLFVDAANFAARPAQCRLLTLSQLLDPADAGLPAGPKAREPLTARPATPPNFSLHQTDLTGVLRLARQFYRVPPTWLLAIQVESVEPRDTLSEPLAAALPRLTEIVRRLARRLVRTRSPAGRG